MPSLICGDSAIYSDMVTGEPRRVVIGGEVLYDCVEGPISDGWQERLAAWVREKCFHLYPENGPFRGSLSGYVWWLIDRGYLPDPDE